MADSEAPLHSSKAEETAQIVSVALQAIPHAGGILASAANYFLEKRKNRRLNRFLINLSDDLRSLKERINRDFVKLEEFKDLVEDIFSKASESRQQEKLDAYRSIFVNTVISDGPNYDEVAEVASLVEGWQPKHIILLRILGDPRSADRKMGNPVGVGGGFSTSINQILQKLLPEWHADQIDRTWKDLHDARVHNTPGTKTTITDKGIHQLENRLTDFGSKIVEYLREPEI